MIKKIIHFSDLHLRLFKEHERYRDTLEECLEKWKKENPDRIVFTGDLVNNYYHEAIPFLDCSDEHLL